MSYLEKLKQLKEPVLAADTTDKSPFDPFGSNDSGHISENENQLEAAEERAAIMEYDGGLSRSDAEKYAVEAHLQPYFFTCSDGSGTFLSKCQTIDEARKALECQFSDKLVKVEECS